MTRHRRRLGVALGLLGAGLLGVSWWLGGRLTAPANAAVGPKPSDFELDDVEFDSGTAHVRGWWHRGERGGAAALLGARPIAVDALVLEAVYPSLLEAIEARIAMRIGRLSSKVLAPLFLAQVKPRLGAPASALRPIDGIRKLTSPVLVTGGANDPKTPFAHTERLYAAAPEPKELWKVEGAAHEDFLARDPAGYRARVVTFLRRHLDRPTLAARASSGIRTEGL